MSADTSQRDVHANDSKVDAAAAVAVITIVVVTVVYWLGGM